MIKYILLFLVFAGATLLLPHPYWIPAYLISWGVIFYLLLRMMF